MKHIILLIAATVFLCLSCDKPEISVDGCLDVISFSFEIDAASAASPVQVSLIPARYRQYAWIFSSTKIEEGSYTRAEYPVTINADNSVAIVLERLQYHP